MGGHIRIGRLRRGKLGPKQRVYMFLNELISQFNVLRTT